MSTGQPDRRMAVDLVVETGPDPQQMAQAQSQLEELTAACPDTRAAQTADPFTLAALLARFSEDDYAALPVELLEVVVAATQRIINAVTTRQAVAIDAYHGRVVEHLAAQEAAAQAEAAATGTLHIPDVLDPDRACASMLAPILRVAPRTMTTRQHRALILVNELPRTLTAAWAGDLEPVRVEAIVTASAPVRYGLLAEYDARVHHDDDLTSLPPAAVRTRAAAAALRTDPDGVAAHHQQATRRRRVIVHPGETPGMSSWYADLPADTSQQMWAAVQALADELLAADRAAGTPTARTLANARADALSAVVLSNATITTHLELVLPIAPDTGHDAATGPDTTSSDDPSLHATGPTTTHKPTRPTSPPTAVKPTRPTSPPTAVKPTRPTSPPTSPPTAVKPTRATPPPPTPRGPQPLDPDSILATMIRGEVTTDTCQCTPLEWDLALTLQRPSAIADNPRLVPSADGPWFVPRPVIDPRVGVLLPDMITQLLADPDLQLTLIHPTSTTTTTTKARRTYRPGAELARAVRARDQHCRFPGCAVPASKCDLDHAIRYPDGDTTESNLHALCRFHHLFKHHAGWRVTLDPDGTCTWTAPTGRTHSTRPPNPHDLAA